MHVRDGTPNVLLQLLSQRKQCADVCAAQFEINLAGRSRKQTQLVRIDPQAGKLLSDLFEERHHLANPTGILGLDLRHDVAGFGTDQQVFEQRAVHLYRLW